MRVWHLSPYSINKNLGAEYNACLDLIPDGDSACLQDGDSMHLIPDWGHMIHEYAVRNPDAVLTCWINRIHELARGQKMPAQWCHPDNLVDLLKVAGHLAAKTNFETTPITGSVSGTLLVVPKAIWKRFPFSEVNTYRPNEPNILGCDNEWTNRIRANGIQVLRMDGVLIYHQYRLLSGNKDHLL